MKYIKNSQTNSYLRKNLKKFLILLGVVCSLIFLAFGMLVLAWVNDSRLKEVVEFFNQSKNITYSQARGVVLEPDSFLHKGALEAFYLFSKEEELYDRWLQENKVNLEETNLVANSYLVNEKLEISGLHFNECSDPFCYQRKISFSEVSSQIWKSLIGIEDKRYVNHKGVDVKSIARALIVDIKAMKIVQGGSTLTQQLVKNLFLTNEKSIKRKIKEIIFAIYLEKKLTKEEILIAYLNENVWGAMQGIRLKGVFAASLFYFQKKPSHLSQFESIILISLLKGPNFFHPIRNLERLKKRSMVVYDSLMLQGLISRGTKSWTDQIWQNWKTKLIKLDEEKPYFSFWALKPDNSILNDFERFNIERVVTEKLRKLREQYKEKSYSTKIYIGDPYCHENCKESYQYYSSLERNLKTAIEKEYHQVGSILKPLIFNELIKLGLKKEDMVSTKKITLRLKSGLWSPKESNKADREEITVLEALRKSRNRPLIRLSQKVGFEILEGKLLPIIPRLKTPLMEFPSQLIGSIELSLAEIYEIYKEFIVSECQKQAIADKNLFENEKRDWMSILYDLSDPNDSTIRYRAHKVLKGYRFFGKTGTTNNGLDNWYIFFDGQFLGVIWTGLDGNRTDKSYKLSGSSAAFPIFNDFSLSRGKRISDFSCLEQN